MPKPMPVRYRESLVTKMTEEFCRQIIEGVVESALQVVTGSQAIQRTIGRPRQKTPATFVLPQRHVCEAEATTARVSAEIPRDVDIDVDVSGRGWKRRHTKWTDDQKQIAVSTAERFDAGGRSSAVRFLQINFPDVFCNLTETNVRYWLRMKEKGRVPST